MADNQRRTQMKEKRLNSLLSAASATARLKSSITEKTDPRDMTREQKEHIIYLDDEHLLDDPRNDEIYGADPDADLIEAMKKYGFQGVILAYPVGGGKYMIESGHRRRAAARKAGIGKYRVFETDAPKNANEQQMRLLLSNLHSRKMTPIRIAKIAQSLYDTHKAILDAQKADGTLDRNKTTALNQLVASDLEMDDSTVSRYRALLKLTPQLQSLADSGDYSWSDLSKAATLGEAFQNQLYEKVMARSKQYGVDSITRKWLQQEISALKADAVEDSGIMETKEKRARIRSYTMKSVLKNVAGMREMLSGNIKAEGDDKDTIITALEETRDEIERKLEELKSR